MTNENYIKIPFNVVYESEQEVFYSLDDYFKSWYYVSFYGIVSVGTPSKKIMTKLRNTINEREDELYLELDSLFNNYSPTEKGLKDFEKIPNQIKDILNKKNDINKKLDDTFLLNSYINDCINIENNLNQIQEKIKLIEQYNQNQDLKIHFFPDEKNIKKIYNTLKSFGIIYKDENEKSNCYIYEEEKELIELKSKIKELENKIKKIKQNNESEKNKLEKNLDEIKNELNKVKEENKELRNNFNKSKIHFTIRSKKALNKCLDTKDTCYGRTPHLWDYGHHNKNQIFELIKNWDGTYLIKNSASELYLGFDSDKIVFRRRNENSQNFYLHHYGDGYYVFQEKNGKTIDLYDNRTNNGAYIGGYGRHNGDNQQWKLVVHL